MSRVDFGCAHRGAMCSRTVMGQASVWQTHVFGSRGRGEKWISSPGQRQKSLINHPKLFLDNGLIGLAHNSPANVKTLWPIGPQALWHTPAVTAWLFYESCRFMNP